MSAERLRTSKRVRTSCAFGRSAVGGSVRGCRRAAHWPQGSSSNPSVQLLQLWSLFAAGCYESPAFVDRALPWILRVTRPVAPGAPPTPGRRSANFERCQRDVGV